MSPIISLWGFFQMFKSGLIWPNIELIRNFIVVLLTCKNEELRIKNKVARVFTTFPLKNRMGVICCHGNRSSGPIWP